MARHALKGKRVPLPAGVRPHRHRRVTVSQRLVLVAVTFLAIRLAR
jgi:hypothetical protein